MTTNDRDLEHVEILRAATAQDSDDLARNVERLDPVDVMAADDVARQLLPLLYRTVRRLTPESELVASLAPYYKQTWAMSQAIVTGAEPIFARLDEIDSRGILLKGGAMLSDAYHDDLGVRPIADLDILVERHLVRDVVTAAIDDGWRVSENRSVDQHLDAHHAVNLFDDRRGSVDVHWELLALDRSPTRTATLFGRSQPAHLGGRAVRVLPPTLQLFHTLSHSNPDGLRHIADAITILRDRADEIDWDELVEEADARREISSTTGSLRYCEQVRPDLVPQSTLDSLDRVKRHWTDFPFAGETVGSRREGVKRIAADWAGRSRGASPVMKLRVGALVVRAYTDASGLSLRDKLLSFATKGPTGGVVEPEPAEPGPTED